MLIELRGAKQVDIAKSIGTYPSRVSEWVNETGKPSIKQALQLARALNVPLDYLADDDADDPPSVPLTERERQVWEVVRTIGPDEAWRRLVGAGIGARAEPPIEAAQDQAGAARRRQTKTG